MALADTAIERRQIVIKGGSFELSGLSLDAFTTLIRTHLPDLEAVYELVENTTNGLSDLTEADLQTLVIAVAEQAPGFVANLIALSAGETSDKAIKVARSLPFPLQVKCLMEVVDLTFDEVGGIKKSIESVMRLLKSTKKSATAIPA